MFGKVVPITQKAHKKTRIKKISSFNFAGSSNLASIMVHEFSRSAATYPIVFLEDSEKDEFRPVALLGLEQGQNLFVQDDKWKASYIPAIVRRYPFALAKVEGDRFTICIDEESDLVNEEEGELLFNDKGEPSEMMENVKKYLGELQSMEVFTREFSAFLKEKNMFTPLNMRVRAEKEVKSINGCYVVNEERLNNLSNDKFIEFRTKKYLSPIYSHLTSLAQIERLVKLREDITAT